VREIWAIRIRLQLAEWLRDLALFNLAIDSKLRGCDLVALRVRDVAHGGTVAHRAIVLQHKTQQPVQFELTDQTRESVAAWIAHAKLRPEGFLFPGRVRQSPHLTTRQYARLVNGWVAMVGLDPADYGTHSLTPDQGDLDLPANEEPAGRTAAARPSQIGKHRPIPWRRGRGRVGDFRADRGVGNRRAWRITIKNGDRAHSLSDFARSAAPGETL
jgi:hypothetical protein